MTTFTVKITYSKRLTEPCHNLQTIRITKENTLFSKKQEYSPVKTHKMLISPKAYYRIFS